MFSIFTQHIYVVEFTRGRPNTPEELFGPEETSALLMFNERLLSV
jgi:hypothetical protein